MADNNFVSYSNIEAILNEFNSKGVKVFVRSGDATTPSADLYGAYFDSDTNKIYCRVKDDEGNWTWSTSSMGGLGDAKTGWVEQVTEAGETTNYLHLGYYEEEHELEPAYWHDAAGFTKFEIPAGGGGGSTVVTISDEEVPTKAIYGAESLIKFYWTSTKQGVATGKAKSFVWKVNGTVVLTETNVEQKPASGGEKYSLNIGQYLSTGTNTIDLTITDIYNTSVSPSWTIPCSAYSVNFLNLEDITYCGTEEKLVQYQIVGTGKRYLEYRLDAEAWTRKEVTSTPVWFAVGPGSHGAHSLQARLAIPLDEAEQTFYCTDPISAQLVWISETNKTPIISVYNNSFEVKQYTKANVKFRVFRPNGSGGLYEATIIKKTAYHNGVKTIEQDETVDSSLQEWRYSANDTTTSLTTDDKLHISTVHEGETIEEIVTVKVVDSGMELNIIRTNLIMDVDPSGEAPGTKKPGFGYTEYNSSGEKVSEHPFTYSDNFDWVNGGFQNDETNECTTFVIKRGTYVDFDRSLFLADDDTGTNGKTIQIIFKTTNMEKYDTVWAHCQSPDETTAQPSLSFHGHYAGFGFKKNANSIKTYYDENSLTNREVINEINLTFTSKGNNKLIRFWDGGVPANGMLYQTSQMVDTTENFRIGSDECDVIIYRFKMYTIGLSDVNILDQYIADAITLEKKADRYNQNNILDDSKTTIDQTKLLNNCPGLHVINISAKEFPPTKGGDGKKPCIITHRINRGTIENPSYPTDEQWTTKAGKKDPLYTLQGTSSMEYVEAAPNLDLDMKKCKMIRIEDEQELTNGYSFNENHIPVKYFNLKANVASSECANNRCLVYRSNDYDQCETLAKAEDSRVRNTLYGEPCAVFLTNSGTEPLVLARDASQPGAARTIPAGETIFYFAGDMLNSKKNTEVCGQIYWDGVNHSGGMEQDETTGKWHDAATMENFQTCIEFGENNKTMCLFKNLPTDLENEAFEIDPSEEFIKAINDIGSQIPGWSTLSWSTAKKERFDPDKSNFCSRYEEDNWGWGFTIKNADYDGGSASTNKELLYKAINDEIQSQTFTEEQKEEFANLIKCQNYFEKGFEKFKELYTFVSSCSPYPKDTDESSEYYYPSGYTLEQLSETFISSVTESAGMRNYTETPENTYTLKKRAIGTTPITSITYTTSAGVIVPITNYVYENGTVTVDVSEIPEGSSYTFMDITYNTGYDRDTKDYRRAKFSQGVSNYVHVNNMLFHYLYTEFFQLVDNRAKNTFWSFEPLSDGTWKWNVCKNYDNDTAIGTTNKGDLELRYGLEDLPLECPEVTETHIYTAPTTGLFEFNTTNKIVKIVSLTRSDTGAEIASDYYDYFNRRVVLLDTLVGENITLTIKYEYQPEAEEGTPQYDKTFNASQSAFWCNIRDTQSQALKTMYATLENAGCFDATNVENEFYNYQKIRPEMLMVYDAEAKYLSPLVTGTTASKYFTTMEFGEKIGQREQFLHYQEIYFASKYISPKVKGSNITMHVYPAPEGQTYSSNILLSPYTDMYATLSIDGSSNSTPVRISEGEEKYVQFIDGAGNPFVARNEVNAMIYAGYNYTEIDNIAHMYAKTFTVGGNSKLGSFQIGSTDPNFHNTNFEMSSFASLPLVKNINLNGCTNFDDAINFENDNINILQKFDSYRTALSSIKFASGSPLTEAKVPNTTSSVSVTKLKQLTPTTFLFDGYNSLTNLYVEDCVDESGEETFPTSTTFIRANNKLKYIGLYDSNMKFDDARYLIKAIYPEAFESDERWKGIPKSESGSYTDKARITGNIYVDTIGTTELDKLLGEESGGVRPGGYFDPTETTITYDTTKLVQGETIFKVEYLKCDETTVDKTQYILVDTTIGTNPYGEGGWTIPTKPDSDDGHYYYIYNGKFKLSGTETEWNFATDKVDRDIQLVPLFNEFERKFIYRFTSDESGTTKLYDTVATTWGTDAKFSAREVEAEGHSLPTKEGYLCTGFITYQYSRTGGTIDPSEGRIRFVAEKNTYAEDPMYSDPDYPYSTTCVPIFEEIKLPAVGTKFKDMTWAQVVKICNEGQVDPDDSKQWVTIGESGTKNVWFTLRQHADIAENMDDVKQISCDNYDKYYIQPTGYLSDKYSDDTTIAWEDYSRIPVTFGTVDLSNAKMKYNNNSSSTTTYDWKGSNIRAFLNGSNDSTETSIQVTRNYNSEEGESGTQTYYWKSSSNEMDAYKYNLPIDLYQAIHICCNQNMLSNSTTVWNDVTSDTLFVPSVLELGLDNVNVKVRTLISSSSTYSYEKNRYRPAQGGTEEAPTAIYPIYGIVKNTYDGTRLKNSYSTSLGGAYWSRHASSSYLNQVPLVADTGLILSSLSESGSIYYYYPSTGSGSNPYSFPIYFCIGTPRT